MSLSKPYLLTIPAKEPFTVECWQVEQTGLAYYRMDFPEELVDPLHFLIAAYPHTDRYLVLHATSGLQVSPIGHWFYTETQAQAFSKKITEFFDWTCDQSHFKTMTHIRKQEIHSICENCYWQILAHYHRYKRETIENTCSSLPKISMRWTLHQPIGGSFIQPMQMKFIPIHRPLPGRKIQRTMCRRRSFPSSSQIQHHPLSFTLDWVSIQLDYEKTHNAYAYRLLTSVKAHLTREQK